MSNQVMHFLR